MTTWFSYIYIFNKYIHSFVHSLSFQYACASNQVALTQETNTLLLFVRPLRDDDGPACTTVFLALSSLLHPLRSRDMLEVTQA